MHPFANMNLVSTTSTEWALHQMLSQHTAYQHFVPGLPQIAEVCVSLSVSNIMPGQNEVHFFSPMAKISKYFESPVVGR